MLDIAVVIINYNGDSVLQECLLSCISENISPSDIVVIDNGSTDESQKLCEKYASLTFIKNQCNKGFSRAVNVGISACKTKYVLILNNDARLLPGSIEHLCACADGYPGAAFVGARLVDEHGRYQNVVAEFPRWWKEIIPRVFLRRGKADPKMSIVEDPIVVPSFVGAAFLVRTEVLPDLGLLDEEFFFYLEETEWCHRAHQKGYSVIFCPQATIEHKLGATANRYRGGARIEFHRSRLIYARKVEGRFAYKFVSFSLFVSSFINFFANLLLSMVSAFLVKKIRWKMAMYAEVFAWHLLGRPRNWGLPGKCKGID